jgi:DNA-binding MarR family transcriptional regulator
MGRAEIIQEIIENLAKCQRPPIDAAWKKAGLSHAQLGMLYMLLYHREASPKEIADYLSITKSAVTQLMDPLVEKSLVVRRTDPKDRRVIRLSLSAEGTKLIQKFNKYKYAGLRSALNSLEGKDLDQLNSIHQRMYANITKQK